MSSSHTIHRTAAVPFFFFFYCTRAIALHVRNGNCKEKGNSSAGGFGWRARGTPSWSFNAQPWSTLQCFPMQIIPYPGWASRFFSFWNHPAGYHSKVLAPDCVTPLVAGANSFKLSVRAAFAAEWVGRTCSTPRMRAQRTEATTPQPGECRCQPRHQPPSLSSSPRPQVKAGPRGKRSVIF